MDAFDYYPGNDSGKGDAFDNYLPEEESLSKSSLRTALQIPQGIAEATPYGIATGAWNLAAQGELQDPEDLEHIRKIAHREGIPFNEEEFLQKGQEAISYIPTISNLGRIAEEKTGIPLEAKTRLQKGLRFASTATKAIPKPSAQAPKGFTFRGMNTGLPRPVLGAGVEGVRETLIEMGIPEQIADLASFAIVKKTPESGGVFSVGKDTKPSGMISRRYEKLTNPKEVAPSTIQKINSKTEKEFRDLTDKIIEVSPIKETHEALAKDITFKKNAAEALNDVQVLADTLPKTFKSKSLKSDLENIITKKKNEALTPSEFDKAHNKFVKQFIEETPDKPFTASQIVKQYRKNNSQLSEVYEPGQSFAYNRAKREALLDYNRSLASMIEKEFPGSEFSKLFKETNKRWADISNSEAITHFLDDLFTGKTNFKVARQIFDKAGMTIPFKKALGGEGFAKFETLLNDLVSTEKGMKMLKSAENSGWPDLAKTASSYILHPTAAKTKIGYDLLKGGYNKIFEWLLDKPQMAVVWDRGINAFKKGNYKAAEKEFKTLRASEIAFDAKEKSRVDSLKKFNQKKKASSNEEIIKVEPSKKESESPKLLEHKKSNVKENSSFTTSKGSTYKINENGTTTRNKAYRREHGEKEQGLQDTSEKTYYITQDDANKLSIFQTTGGGDKKLFEYPDGRLGIMFESGKNKGKVSATSIITPKNQPKEGLLPIESFQGGRRVHFGNKITKVSQSPQPKKLTKFEEDHLFGKNKRVTENSKQAKKQPIYSNQEKKSPKPAEKLQKPKDIDEKIEKVKRQDISPKGLKDQKNYLLNEIENARSNPTESPYIVFDVPGDGTFKIKNMDDVLKEFMAKVKKNWPVKPLRTPLREKPYLKSQKKSSPKKDK